MVKYVFIILFLVSCGIIHHTTVTPQVTAILNGSKSYDPDGYIKSWSWKSLTNNSIISNDSITKVLLPVGTYLFELTVTDNQNAQAKDTTRITVLQ